MDRWEDKPLSKGRSQGHQREINPSFSSTLLDAIYRSIDESNSTKGDQEELILYRETTRKKHGNYALEQGSREVGRACMMEKWMEKKVSYEKVVVPRKSMVDFDGKLLNSCSSSSESSCGGGFFSSSESESFYGLNSRSPTPTMQIRPRPIRTGIPTRPGPERPQRPQGETDMNHHHHPQKPKHEGGGGGGGGGFSETKSKALKIYGNLKKAKQPISPGSRLASFLNSLFNAKKANISSSSSYKDSSSKLKSEQESSTCSSSSSFSRSCLSKTPSSSRGKLSNGNNRSVRFCPVSVIVDEDRRPCGHKTLYKTEESLMTITARNEETKFHVLNENRHVEEVTRNLLNKYEIRKKEDTDLRDAFNGNEWSSESDQEEDDDAASYASSDLFELDNLSAIGIERYREELPVYETTNLSTNQVIANGLIL